jgi:hypothetical protein
MRQEPNVPDNALCGHSPAAGVASALQAQDSRLAHNCLYLSGVLAADPIEDRGRDGEPVDLLTIAFPAPDASDTRERVEISSCEVEVPAGVVGSHDDELRTGTPVFITGQLSGGGGVIATELHSGPPVEMDPR